MNIKLWVKKKYEEKKFILFYENIEKWWRNKEKKKTKIDRYEMKYEIEKKNLTIYKYMRICFEKKKINNI